MNKIELAFIKSHLKKAIYELETTNKLKPNTVSIETIIELKIILRNLEEEN
jgi:hypothetical protein